MSVITVNRCVLNTKQTMSLRLKLEQSEASERVTIIRALRKNDDATRTEIPTVRSDSQEKKLIVCCLYDSVLKFNLQQEDVV